MDTDSQQEHLLPGILLILDVPVPKILYINQPLIVVLRISPGTTVFK